MQNTKPLLDLEVQQYSDFPQVPRKTALVTVVGRPEADGKLHGIAMMMGHGEPSPEADAELLRMAHLFKAAPRLFSALECCKNRLETVLEAHPEIHVEQNIVLAYGALWDALNAKRSWRDAITIAHARGEWTPEMEAQWEDHVDSGPTNLPCPAFVDKSQGLPPGSAEKTYSVFFTLPGTDEEGTPEGVELLEAILAQAVRADGYSYAAFGAKTRENLRQLITQVSAPSVAISGEWAIVELMGHMRYVGRVSEETRFGVVLGRVDVPKHDSDDFDTTYFSGQSIYRLTPVTEEFARMEAAPYVPARRAPRALPAPSFANDEGFDNSDPFADE